MRDRCPEGVASGLHPHQHPDLNFWGWKRELGQPAGGLRAAQADAVASWAMARYFLSLGKAQVALESFAVVLSGTQRGGKHHGSPCEEVTPVPPLLNELRRKSHLVPVGLLSPIISLFHKEKNRLQAQNLLPVTALN